MKHQKAFYYDSDARNNYETINKRNNFQIKFIIHCFNSN